MFFIVIGSWLCTGLLLLLTILLFILYIILLLTKIACSFVDLLRLVVIKYKVDTYLKKFQENISGVIWDATIGRYINFLRTECKLLDDTSLPWWRRLLGTLIHALTVSFFSALFINGGPKFMLVFFLVLFCYWLFICMIHVDYYWEHFTKFLVIATLFTLVVIQCFIFITQINLKLQLIVTDAIRDIALNLLSARSNSSIVRRIAAFLVFVVLFFLFLFVKVIVVCTLLPLFLQSYKPLAALFSIVCFVLIVVHTFFTDS